MAIFGLLGLVFGGFGSSCISSFFSFLSIKVAFFQFVQCCLLRFLCVKFWGFWILCVLYFPLFVWFDFVEFEMFVVNVQAFDAFIGADFLGRFTRYVQRVSIDIFFGWFVMNS
ncbi:hypothetical protein Scep_011831 [Stephania cephalantha]|uniref:Uncharacterized protein n=1 Tax=Stephania cephalantha TaxID=152367 RepID=A0AAP0JFV6_9MAGN